jgi:hypothetical protein
VNGRTELDVADLFVEALRPLIRQVVREELERIGARTTRPSWMTVEEFADVMRTTPAAVRARLERGRVPGAVKEGRRWLIPSSASKGTVDASETSEGRAPTGRPRPGTRR